ncbi:MAG: peptidoglycan-binding protein [Candidatus Omnitrophica bacterium]|nr:peptidoglycan-binding protein [Candidatus Omnitrophota bacterium]
MLIVLTGCATTQDPTDINKLQIKVAQLERKLEERDQQINEMRYEIKDLSVQVDDGGSYKLPAIVDEPNYSDSKSSSDSSSDERIIRVNASALDVQKALKNAGYYEGAIDGKVGKKTKSAISNFQKDHGLKADGIIGRKTWSELKNYL